MIKPFFSAFLFFSILSLFGCKKDSGSDGYYMTMLIDNKAFSFSDSLVATKQSGQPRLQIFAHGKDNGEAQLLFSDFSNGTYTDTYDTTVQKVIYQFTINAVIGYNNGAPVIQMFLRPGPNSVSNPISLTISNVTSSYVEGSFGGAVSNGATTAVISKGRFKVPFK
jgi:hypothetical protein